MRPLTLLFLCLPRVKQGLPKSSDPELPKACEKQEQPTPALEFVSVPSFAQAPWSWWCFLPRLAPPLRVLSGSERQRRVWPWPVLDDVDGPLRIAEVWGKDPGNRRCPAQQARP